MDAQREEPRVAYGELLYLRGPYIQYRLTFASRRSGTSPILRSLTLVLIDSRRGPTAEQAQALAIATAPLGPVVISRAAWGADESLMTWPPEYRAPRKFVIHHTATPNGDLDPAATVRAIYYYHAVTRGWGDIGYNYLIDAQGRIYEGRKGGEGVVGGHAKQYAWGSIGIALIGDYDQVNVPAAMERSLVEMLAWKGNLHFIHPTGHGFFIDKDLPNIMGHLDVAQTTCPGRYAYARLPIVRQAALTRMADLPPNVRIDAPLPEAQVSGVVNVLATASPLVTQVTFYVDDVARFSAASAPLAWRWNTTATSGQHRLRAQARTAINLLAEQTVTVTVDNAPPNGSLSGPIFSNAPTVTLTTWTDDARWMLFSNGWHWEGEELGHQSGRMVSDIAAWNGWAWLGRAGSDAAGWWYGPYFRELPTGRTYRVYFRLKTTDNSSPAAVATIDVSDKFGANTYISQTLTGQDFGSSSYHEPYLDFSYYRHDDYGLEFRTFYAGRSDLYLDRVYLFGAPRPYATNVDWMLPEGDGPKEVDARYVDAAGNVSSVYSITVVLDTTAPQWLGWDGSYAQVRDALSGLRISSAQFATSTDGGQTWGEWRAATMTATEGTTATVSVSVSADGATAVRFRIADRANNLAESPAYALPTPTPTTTSMPTSTETPSPTASSTPTSTATSVATLTATPSATATHTPIPTVTDTPTLIATATPSPSPTPMPGLGQIRGRVVLQGRSKYGGVNVSIANLISTTTSEDGSYTLRDIPPGFFTVVVRLPGYLETYRQMVTVSTGAETVLPDVILRGGDANGDCSVNLSDLVIVTSNFGRSPPTDGRADLNQDGRVDIFDLLLVSINLGQTCPGPWRP